MTLTLADLKACPRREVEFTLECSGNTGLPVLHRRHRQRPLGGRAAGPAAERRVLDEGTEVVFWGADRGR